MNATGVLGRTRKGLFSGLRFNVNTRAIAFAAVFILTGMILGGLLVNALIGYGAVGSIEVVRAGEDGTLVSGGTVQVYKVLTFFSLEGNPLRIAVGPAPLVGLAP